MKSDPPTFPPLDQQNGRAPGLDWLCGGGEMGERIRAFDWSGTPIGPVERWPAVFSSTLGIVVSARFPMAIYWGEEGWLFYNDAWRPILGDKHPWALGKAAREVWPEIWKDIAPGFDAVRRTGEATWSADSLLPMQRFGYTEECYFDYTFNPIRGADGQVNGILNVVQETTERVLSGRRTEVLRELSARTAAAKTVAATCEAAVASFATDPADFPFSLLYLVDLAGQEARLVAADGVSSESPAHAHEISLDADNAAWPLGEALRTGSTVMVENLEQRFGTALRSPWPEAVTRGLVVPIAGAAQEGYSAVLVVGVNPRRSLDNDYRRLLELASSHLATAIPTADAYASERRRAESLAELDRAKTTFFSNVSHEFRTPLTLMLGPLEEIRARATDAPALVQRGEIDVVHRNSLRLLKLVNTLLDFSRIEAGRAQAAFVETDLARLTAELASVFRSAMAKAELAFVIDCPPLPETVFVDVDLWEKIVFNLLSNALKYTLSGEVRLAVRPHTGHAVLSVRDTGLGIAPADLPNLFKRFHRIENVRGRTHEGTGIGLALVHELVKLHGGVIEVESVPGRGTEFRVRVPFGKNHLPAERISSASGSQPGAMHADAFVEEALSWLPEPADSEARPADGKNSLHYRDNASLVDPSNPRALHTPHPPLPRILLAEDNADMREYVRRLLSEHYEVEAVADGAAAFETARRRPPDLLLSDVMMPAMNGIELVQRLRADEALRTLPIILLSARAGEEARVEGAAQGADDYLTKPFSARELLARVALHLKQTRVRREAAAALSASEGRLRLFIEHAPAALAMFDRDMRYLAASQRWKHDYQLSGDLVGRSHYEIFPRIPERWKAVHARALAGEVMHGDDDPFPSENGTIQFIKWEVRPWQMATGEVGGILIVADDVTQRKQATEALRESEARQKFLLELGDALRPLADPDQIMVSVSRLLGERLQANRVVYFEVMGSDYVVRCDYTNGVSDLSGRYPMASFGARLLSDYRSGRTVLSHNLAADDSLPSADRAAYAAIQIGAHIAVPLVKRGEFVAGLAVHSREPRDWTAGEIALVEETAERTWDAVERARAETALRQARQRFDIVKDSTQVGFWFCDLPFDKLEWDNRVKEHFWLPPEAEVTIATFYERIHPEDREPTRLAIEASIADRTHYEIEYRTVSPAAAVKWIRAIGRGFYDANGQPTRFDGVTLDVTEQKRAQEALRDSEAQLVAATTAGSIGTWNWDLALNLLTANPALLRMFGISPAAAVNGISPESFIAAIIPEDQAAVKAAIAQALAPDSDGVYEAEYRVRPAGEVRWVLARGQVEYDAARNPLRLPGALTDITGRKRAEEVLRDSEAQLAAATVAGAIGTWVWEVGPNVLTANPALARAFGMDVEQVRQGLPAEAYIAAILAEDRPAMKQALARAMTPGSDGVYAVEYRTRDMDGNVRWLFSRGRVEFDAAGNPLRLPGALTDITERKQAEFALQQALASEKAARAEADAASRAKDDFLAALSHELRTPLTPVLMAAAALRDDPGLSDEVREQLGMMERNIALEARLIDDLLDLTAISHGKLTMRLERCDLKTLVERAIEMVARDAVAKELVIACEFSSPQHALMGDLTRLQQVVWNLLRNAVKFTPNGGKISVRTRETLTAEGKPWLTLEIADTGIGIEAAHIAQIFQPFDQGAHSGNHRFGGLGLGLAIARAVVTAHAGRIHARSEGTGRGATFVVDLPLAPAASPLTIQPPPSPPTPLAKIAPLRLLLVEDHQSTLQTIARLLQRDGHRVTTASTIEAAETAAGEHTFDLVISDLGLPDGSGTELMDRLRSSHGLRGIALSGYGMQEDLARSREAGFVAHLVKPVAISDLRRTLEEISRIAP